MAFYGLSKLPLWAFKAAVCPPANAPNLPKPSKPSKPSKTFQALQTPSPAGTPGPRPLPEQAPQGQGHSNGFLWAFKAAVCQPANPPKPSKPSKHRPQQAPQGQGHFPNRHPRAKATAMAFCGLSKLPFASPQTLQNPPNLPNTVPSRHPRAKATSRTGTPGPRTQQWLSMGFQSCRLPARKPSKTLQTLQTPSPAGTPGPRPLPEQAPQGQGHSNGFLWAFKAAVCQPANAPNLPKPSKPSKPSKTFQTLQTPSPAGTPGPRPLPEQAPQGQGHSNGFLWAFKAAVCQPANPPKPSKPSKHRPQQAPQGQGHFPNRHPRAKATAMAFYGLSKLPFASPQTLQNPPNPPNHPRAKATAMAFYGLSKLPFASPQTLQTPPKFQTPSLTGTPGPRPLPEQAPRAKATAMAFYRLSKLPFASPQTLQNPPKPSKPSKHRPQQAPQETFQTLQTPSPAGTPGPRPLPEQAPQGQGHSNGFLWAFKAAVCQPANPPKPSKPSKPPQGQGHSNGFLWAFKAAVCQPANAPNPSKIPNTFPSRHPRAKATSRTGAPGPRPQQWLSIGFQSCRLPARKPSKTLQNPPNPPNTVPSRHPRAKATSRTGTPGPRPQQWLSIGTQSRRLPARKPSKTLQDSKPSKHRPQQAPQGQGHFPNRHPRAKATAMAFYGLSKLPFASPQTLQNPPNPPNHPRAKATAMAFYGLSKLPFASPQTLQTPPKFQTPSLTGTPGPRPLPEQAPQGQGHSNGFLWAFKAAVCQPANPPKPSKPSKHRPQQAPQGQGHFPNRHPRAKATAMAFYGLSKLPFASPQTLQTFQNLPNPPNTVPSRHPRAKATSRTGTPGPRPQQWLSMGFQSCRLPARKPSKTLQTLQTPSPAGTPGPRPLPEQAPQGQGHSNGFLWAFKAAVCQPANPPKPSKPSKPPQGQGHSNGFLWAFKAAVCQLANAPNPSKIPNTFPNRHPRAKATSRTGAPGPRPQQWLSIGFQSCRLPARKPSKTLQTLQTPSPAGTPGNPPNPPNTVPSRHPRAKATSRTGTPGPRPQQWLSMGFQSCRLPARKPSRTLQTLQTTPGPRPQQWLSMGFQSCRLPARKRSKPLQNSKHLP